MCSWAIQSHERGSLQQSSRLVRCSRSRTLKLTNSESLSVIQTSVKVTPSIQPRYIDIFTRLSHRNTPELCKIQYDLAVRTHHNGRIQHCILHLHHEASKANLHFHGTSTGAILFACTDVSFPETAMPLFSLNAIETHLNTTPLKLCVMPWTCNVCFPPASLVLWMLMVVKDIEWQLDTVKAVTMSISSKAERPAFLRSPQHTFYW